MKKLILFFIAVYFIGMVKAQNVGIGTTTPNAKLHVNGTFKVVDGTQGAGRILTSDSVGLASWQSPGFAANYPSVSICCQRWMTRNLDVATYRNGDSIPLVTDNAVWAALTTGAYCYYNNDSATYAAIYGKLYNGYAVTDPRGLAPQGWYTPTDFEWTTIANCLGDATEGGLMKETGTVHWTAPNTGANNFSGFTGLPGGFRNLNGAFSNIGTTGYWWTSTEINAAGLYYRALANTNADLFKTSNSKRLAFSVRCIRE